jgi:hypothetical protein
MTHVIPRGAPSYYAVRHIAKAFAGGSISTNRSNAAMSVIAVP